MSSTGSQTSPEKMNSPRRTTAVVVSQPLRDFCKGRAAPASDAAPRSAPPGLPSSIGNGSRPLDVGAEGDQVFDEARVGSADRVGVEYLRGALDAGGQHQERDRDAD